MITHESHESHESLRPGALCIPPHLQAAIFAPSIDVEMRPRPRSPPQPVMPIAASLPMCADRPTRAERALMRPEPSATTPVVQHTMPLRVPPVPMPVPTMSSISEKQLKEYQPHQLEEYQPQELKQYQPHQLKEYQSHQLQPFTSRYPRLRRFLVTLAVLLSFPLTLLIVSSELVLFGDMESPGLLYASNTSDVPPLPYEWFKRCTDLLVVPKGQYTNRLNKLGDALHSYGDNTAWVAEPGINVQYFLGSFGSKDWKQSERPFIVVVRQGDIILLTPAFEEGRAREVFLPEEVREHVTWVSWSESDDPYAILVEYLGDVDIVFDDAARWSVVSGIRRAQRNEHPTLSADRINAIREVKEPREIGLLRCANEATLHAIAKTRERMWIGMHESAARAILYEEMKVVGLTDYSALVLFGPDAALPHGSGTDRILAKDEFALIDAGGKWGNYVSDITRTFFLPESEIPEAHRSVWEIVRAAQRAPANLLRLIEPTEEAYFSWLDDRARETVKKGMAALGVPPAKGHKPDYTVFTHRLGHGIGLEGHEGPYVVQGDSVQIRPGNVVTLEPGVYVPQDSAVGDERIRGLGVRTEDTVVIVERDGRLALEWLTGPVEKWGDV